MNHTIATWEAAYLRFETPDDEVRKFRAAAISSALRKPSTLR